MDCRFLKVDTCADNVMGCLSRLNLEIMGSTELFGTLSSVDRLRMYSDAPIPSINYIVPNTYAARSENTVSRPRRPPSPAILER